MMRKFLFLLLTLLLISCKSHYFLLKNGESKSNMYTYYCNDSLGIYAKFFGDFSQENFFKPELTKQEKGVLKAIFFQKNKDKVLFHSFTKIVPFYNVIGVLKKEVDVSTFNKLTKNDQLYYTKTNFGLYNTYEIVFPINTHFFSIVFFEKNDSEKKLLQNEIDYQKMIELTLEAQQNKECGKENIISLSDDFFNEEKSGNYLVYKRIEQLEHNYINTNEEGFYHQILATYLSFAQENDKAEAEFNKYTGKKNNAFHSIPIATTTLIDSIKNHSFVLFNEAHHKPKHRYLIGSLLKLLYENGFRYIGFEAFYDENLLNKNGFPTLANGFYVREATMANLIREAKKMGFIVFEYDPNGDQREVNQANIIYDKTIRKDPNAKVIILAGYSHIDEKEGWMAEQLNSKYNINPLTINQTSFSTDVSFSKQKLELVEDTNPHFKNDLFLYNNLGLDNNCFGIRESKNRSIAVENVKSNNCILLVYNNIEYEKVDNPVPVFVKVLEKNQSIVNTNLCLGEYKVVVKNSYNSIVFESFLKVE